MCALSPPPPPPPPTSPYIGKFCKQKWTPTYYISLEREFIGKPNIFWMSTKHFDFAIFYEQYSRSCRNLCHLREFEKYQTIKTKILYIISKYVIWILRTYDLFCEIFKFRDFKKAFMNFVKSIIARIFAIFKYFPKQTIYSDSLDHVLQNDIQNV